MITHQGTIRLGSAKELASHYTMLLSATLVELPSALVYSNLDKFDPIFARHHHEHVYPARKASISEIGLVTWPPDTVLLATEGFPIFVGATTVDEQLSPWLREDPERFENLRARSMNIIDVDQDCLLLARFGEGTWGHWLGELLPRATLAEHFFPGRFAYVVPSWTTTSGSTKFANSVLDSLRAYGIGDDRLYRLTEDNQYRFRSLSTVTPVRSDRAMHPEALQLMRTNLVVAPGAFPGYFPARIAMLRRSVRRRELANAQAVQHLLGQLGFLCLEIEDYSFSAQVALFRAASTVFCVLGSGLTGLIYSPDHVRVIAPAPENWGDSFFYPLVQQRAGKFIDIRGPIVDLDTVRRRDSSFTVVVDELQTTLRLLDIHS